MHRRFCVCLCEMGQQMGTVPADERECATNMLKACVFGRKQLWIRQMRSLYQPCRKHNTAQHTVNQRHTKITSTSHTQSYNVVKSNKFPLTKSLLRVSEWWQNLMNHTRWLLQFSLENCNKPTSIRVKRCNSMSIPEWFRDSELECYAIAFPLPCGAPESSSVQSSLCWTGLSWQRCGNSVSENVYIF